MISITQEFRLILLVEPPPPQAAKAQRVPIYAIKNTSAPGLARALRSLLGMEGPAAGGWVHHLNTFWRDGG